ncbi:MAG: fumarylacetoacetate hydrolase family protein [Rubrivivax sp.]
MNPNPFAEVADLTIPTAPWRLSGTVVGALLNHAADWEALGAAADAPPYKGRAKAPVLHVRPRNTLAGSGAMVAVPAGVEALEVGATLGLVIGRTACRVRCIRCAGLHRGLRDGSRPARAARRAAGALPAGGAPPRARRLLPIGPRVVPAAACLRPMR